MFFNSIKEHVCCRQINSSNYLRLSARWGKFLILQRRLKRSSGRLKGEQESTRVLARSRSLVWQNKSFSMPFHQLSRLESLWVEENVSSIGGNIMSHSRIFNVARWLRKNPRPPHSGNCHLRSIRPSQIPTREQNYKSFNQNCVSENYLSQLFGCHRSC